MSGERSDAYLHQTEEGIFGLESIVDDFDDAELDRIRRVAYEVRTKDSAAVKGAIALAGSAAQSRFQLFPGDCDFFERVNIQAPTRAAAMDALGASIIETIAAVFPHPDLQFSELKFGLHGSDALRGEEVIRAGTPISWSLADVDARSIAVEEPGGKATLIEFGKIEGDPGFVKLDWVYADPEEDRIVAVSKVIDATWEAPDGTVTPLDGVVDSFYQEVYLDPESRGLVEELIDEVRPSGLSHYVEQLEKEIAKYTAAGHENYGKVAKRLYNIFRVTGRSTPAAYLRSLFDDPAARLYQIPGALHALENVFDTRRLDTEIVAAQVSEMVDIVGACYTGSDKDDLVVRLRSLADVTEEERPGIMSHVTERVSLDVSTYFQEALGRDEEIRAYLSEIGAAG